MSSWKLVNKTLLYDGSFYGLLTIVFDCFYNKTLPAKICSRDCYVNNFLDDVYYIDTDEIKSQRVFMSLHFLPQTAKLRIRAISKPLILMEY